MQAPRLVKVVLNIGLGEATSNAKALEAAERGAERLRQAVESEEGGRPGVELAADAYHDRFIEAMNDDFNTAQALGTLFDLAREINRLRDSGYSVEEGQNTFVELASVLGLTLKAPEKQLIEAAPFIGLLVEIRKQLRTAKQFQLADEIRKKLDGLGIALEDTPKGTVWKQKR